jgi:rhodanese-related sulfurtransferase
MKKIIVVLSSVLLISTYSCSGSSNPNATTQEVIQQEEVIVDVTVNQFKDLIATEGTLLDVRTPEEWAEGIIPNAEKINYHGGDFESQIEKLDKTKPVFIYCRSGRRSANAANVLKGKGFVKIYNLNGGILDWINSGNETIK